MPATENTRLLKTTLDLCVLALLESGDSYGYELAKTLEARGYPVQNSRSLYPVLKRLQSQKLIESYLEPSTQGPARKYHRITPEGRKALRQCAEHTFRVFEIAWDVVTK